LTAGTRIGPYEIVGPLGAGGMGEVYRARDTKLQRDAAEISSRITGSRRQSPWSVRTRGANARPADHPNIAQIYGLL
jgi:serine/threonine protein kinase